MAVLSVVSAVSAVVGADIPQRVFGSSDRHSVEMQHLINEAARDIVDRRDWLALARRMVLTGDGARIAFDLPADFGRFRLNAHFLSTDTGWRIPRLDGPEAAIASDYGTTAISESWRLEGGQIVIFPSLGVGATVETPYQSKHIVITQDGAQAEFDADDQAFALDERLLKLAMIWMWKANKGLPYGQDFDNFEKALNRAISQDGPRSAISLARSEYFRDDPAAFPRTVGPGGGTGTDYVSIYEGNK